nr:hypothetical protein [Tanacetum cinerariifolium]
MATTIDQLPALDESLVPSMQRAFQVTADVPDIYMQEFWDTAKLHHNSIRFKIDTRKSVLDLEAFREMLHISPRIPNQPFADLPIEEEILDFLSEAYKEYHACAMGEAAPKPKASSRKKKGNSTSSTTPPTPTPTTTVVSAPWLSATAKGKQPSRATTPTEPTDVERTEAKQLKIVLKKSRQETHISQQCGSGTDEGTGSKPGVPNLPSDDSEEELSWKSSDDEYVGGHEEGNKSDESDDDRDEGSDDDSDETVKAGAGKDDDDEDDDDNDEEEELAKSDEEDKESGKGGDEVRESKESEEERNDEEEQDLRLSEEARIQEEEDADELYRDVNINQGRGLQEFWATAKLHHNSIRFKIDTKKSILDLEAFREMLHISPRIPNQSFADLPTEEEILDFLRSFASVINKCLTGKSSGVDSFRLSQAQMLWGFYHRINIDFAYLIWEDFVYRVEHKNQKRSNEMYYLRFMKVVIDYFMTRKPSISRRNRINWHYVRDDVLFSTIKVVSRHQSTQQYGAILPIELTTDEIRNSKAYKEYYACATGEAAPKPKASARKKKGKQPSRATNSIEPIDVQRTEAEQLKIVLKWSRQETHISQQSGSGTDKGTCSKPGVPDVPSDDSEKELSWNSSDDEDYLRLSEEARIQEEEDADELYRDVNINQGRGLQVTQNVEDTHVTLTPVNPDGPQESSAMSSFVSSMLNLTCDVG